MAVGVDGQAASTKHSDIAPNSGRAASHTRDLLASIKRAHAAGKSKKATELTRIYLHSWDARLTAVHAAYRQLKAGARPNAAMIPAYAQSLDPWKGTTEVVLIRLKAKDGNRDDHRTILEFGIENRALQYLVERVLRVRADLHPNQYAMRGTHKAIERVASLMANGHSWAIETDIKSCYPSFDGEKVAHFLPLPERVVQHTLLGTSLTLRLGYPNMFGAADPGVDDELVFPDLFADARRGFPQGSAASPLAVEMLLAPIFNKLPAGSQVIGYADNFLAMAKGENDAVSMTRALWSALSAHPVGQFLPKPAKVFQPGEPIEFLGHQLQKTSGGILIEPSQKNKQRFEKTVHVAMSGIKSCGMKDDRAQRRIYKLQGYIRSWTHQFRTCQGVVKYRDAVLAKAGAAHIGLL